VAPPLSLNGQTAGRPSVQLFRHAVPCIAQHPALRRPGMPGNGLVDHARELGRRPLLAGAEGRKEEGAAFQQAGTRTPGVVVRRLIAVREHRRECAAAAERACAACARGCLRNPPKFVLDVLWPHLIHLRRSHPIKCISWGGFSRGNDPTGSRWLFPMGPEVFTKKKWK
jgi:hypothetical protein